MAFASSKIGAQEAITKPCDLCEDDENVNWFCKDCDQNLCDRCKRSHLRSNISKSHIVLSISEGFAMGKMNISNMCRDHDEPFQFFCKTCDRNICAKCLSTKHKKHDFIDLRDLQSEVQKQLDDVIKEKEDEVQKMTKAHDDLDQHENESENYLKEKYASIYVNVKAIQKAAAEEGEKMKQSLYERIEQRDKEVKEGKQKIQGQTKVHRNEIHTIQQQLRLQTASSCHNFVKESKSKLQSLRFLSITIPDIGQLYAEGRVDRNQIRQMIGNIGKMAEVSVMGDLKGNDETTRGNVLSQGKDETTTGNVLSQGKDETTTGNVLSQLEIIRTLKLNEIEECYMFCICVIPDGSIWIGCKGYVYKMSSDYTTVLHQIPARESWLSCIYIACLQSGDAVVSYGVFSSYIDRFTSDGRRVEFTDLSPRRTYDIAVNINDEVVVNVSSTSLIIFSNNGKQLREINVIGGIKTFCIDRKGNFIIAHPNSSNISLVEGTSGKVIATWSVSTSDIARLTCDGYGNILATNRNKNVYFFRQNGDVEKTLTVDCDAIKGICLNGEGHLLILVGENEKYKILVAKYLE